LIDTPPRRQLALRVMVLVACDGEITPTAMNTNPILVLFIVDLIFNYYLFSGSKV